LVIPPAAISATEALFVTLRTMETHLTHTYRKLDIRSWAELGGCAL